MFQSVYIKDVFYIPVLFKAHKLEKKFSEILDFDKLELFFPHLMFTLSLSDSPQRKERKCEFGTGVYR